MAHTCPRDGTDLRRGSGALAEDVCPRCHGRLLDTATSQRLFVDILGIRAEVLLELARAGVPRGPCPSCDARIAEVRARGVLVDLCPSCGCSWLDGGELARLAKDVVEEIRVGEAAPDGSGLELDLSKHVEREPVRFQVLCVNCDATLDLTKTNWLINTRPWCPSCARPYVGIGSLLPLPGGWFGFFAGVLLSSRSVWFRLWRAATDAGEPLSRTPDVLRIVPKDAEQYFASFFVRAR
ncbi:MAG: zf-TFIIB domain-containing protein [Deltaproteobacteria bacterium]|nr:zf-TFIIB domain-containing protein [Deltaproteobacteria bacterium]